MFSRRWRYQKFTYPMSWPEVSHNSKPKVYTRYTYWCLHNTLISQSGHTKATGETTGQAGALIKPTCSWSVVWLSSFSMTLIYTRHSDKIPPISWPRVTQAWNVRHAEVSKRSYLDIATSTAVKEHAPGITWNNQQRHYLSSAAYFITPTIIAALQTLSAHAQNDWSQIFLPLCRWCH